MKKLLATPVLSACVVVPSFARDIVGHTAKVAGKDTAKGTSVAAKHTAKATVKAVKFLF